jgi:hypothetical protein
MTYETDIKTARMIVVRDALNGGIIDLLNAALGVLWTNALNPSSGSVVGDTLTLAGFPKSAAAIGASSWDNMVRTARFRRNNGNSVKRDLAVGLTPAAAPLWVGLTAYSEVDATRTNGTEIYRVVTPGTSASSGGPTGTGASILDGTVTWAWVCSANAPVQVSSLRWNVGDTITVQAGPTISHAL